MTGPDAAGGPERRPSDRPIGVIYVAIGRRFVPEARVSAASVRRFLPGVPIVLYTDQETEPGDGFDEILRLPEPHPLPHINKLIAMAQSPFEKTLLLDTDTYVCGDISDLFALLDRFDVAMTQDRAVEETFPPGTGVPDAFVEFNQGVVAYRQSPAMREALQQSLLWVARLRPIYDQPPLRVALFHGGVRIATLPQEYNCRFASYASLNGVVRILHGRLPGRRMRAEDFERVARTLNRVTVPRVVIVGAVLAMAERRLIGRVYWTRFLVGRLYRPYLAIPRYAFSSLRIGIRDEGFFRWFRRMAKRARPAERSRDRRPGSLTGPDVERAPSPPP